MNRRSMRQRSPIGTDEGSLPSEGRGNGPSHSTRNVYLGCSGWGGTEETTVSVGGQGDHSASGALAGPISCLEVVPVEPDPQPRELSLPDHDLLLTPQAAVGVPHVQRVPPRRHRRGPGLAPLLPGGLGGEDCKL